MVDINATKKSFIKELQALWSAENLLTEAMPLMIKTASNLGLKKNLALHLAETDQHKMAIQAICKQFGYDHEGDENEEVKNLLTEGERAVNTQVSQNNVDAAIIAGAIKIEHYEIEQYEVIADQAEALGYEGVAQRLRLTLEEERQADAKLNFLEKELVKQSAEIGASGLALK